MMRRYVSASAAVKVPSTDSVPTVMPSKRIAALGVSAVTAPAPSAERITLPPAMTKAP